jgi:hypothetical protein
MEKGKVVIESPLCLARELPFRGSKFQHQNTVVPGKAEHQQIYGVLAPKFRLEEKGTQLLLICIITIGLGDFGV